jgi:hypothetical protein
MVNAPFKLGPESIYLMENTELMTNTVRGAIGEIIAWQYLVKKLYPAFVQSLQGATPCQAEKYNPNFPFHTEPLMHKQRYYLDGHFKRSWDFIANTRTRRSRNVYLFEVKTSSQTTRHRASWRNRRKIPASREIEKVKSLGFTPILVKILFSHNWKVDISCECL